MKPKTDLQKQRRREASRAYYKRNRIKHMALTVAWRKRNIEKVRKAEREWFSKNPEKMYLKGVKYRAENKEAVRERLRSWTARNKTSKHAKDHRYRSKKVNAPGFDYTTSHHIKWRWEMFGNRCWVCGDVATQTDHVKPLIKGGSHYPANLRPICLSCNSRKKDRWPIALLNGVKANLLRYHPLQPA